MSYIIDTSRSLVALRHRMQAACATLLLLAGCGAGDSSNPILVDNTGSVTLLVSGSGTQGKLQAILSGPGGFQQQVSDAGPITGLPLGSYQIRFLPTLVDGDRWAPSAEFQTILIASPDQPVAVSVQYTLASGTLDLRAEGVPAGTDPVIRVTGPGGYSRDVMGATTIRGLEPGAYTILANPGNVGSAVYRPAQMIRELQVPSSVTPMPAVITYQRVLGTLDLVATGLPSGAIAQYTITGPGNFQATRTGTAHLTALDPGTYLITAAPVPFQGNTWSPTTTSIQASVDTGTTAVAVAHEIATGALALEVEGLPAGVNAPVVNVSGPAGFVRDLNTSEEWAGLAPGTYHARATAFVQGGRRYAPDQEEQDIQVARSTNPSRGKVRYSELKGNLALTLSGLPAGVAGRVVVIGSGFADTVYASGTLSGLPAGTYTVVASSISAGGTVYEPAPSSQAALVVAGEVVAKSVAYAAVGATTGDLSITLSGLPGSTSGAVMVSGPNGFSQAVTATTTLSGLVPGSYTIAAANVAAGGASYQPTPTTQVATVVAGATAVTTVTYAVPSPTTGALTITLSGLPGSTAYAVAVSGPNGYSQAVTATTTLSGLAPGSYAVGAVNVTAGGATYQPTPATQVATITAGETATRAVTYAVAGPTTGGLTVTLSGLPGGTAYPIAVNGPNGYSQGLSETTTLNGLAPGSYTVIAANVTAGGATYQPTSATQGVTVTAGATAVSAVTYASSSPTTGALTITLSGLPGATAYAVAVSGPNGYSQAVTATTTLSGLAPGSYAIAAVNVTTGGATYQPTPTTQSATVTAGATTTRAVAYAVPAPTTGALTVTLSGLPGGTAYPIAVSGPNGYSQGLSATTTLNALAVGSYTIVAANVTVGGATYQPTPATQSASVTAGTTTSRSVVYAAVAAPAPATITVDTTTRFQTMEGWEATAQTGHLEPGGAGWQSSLMDQAVNDLGLNRIRLEIKSGLEGSASYNYTPVNDNSNPNVANLAAFNFTTLDNVIDVVVNPMRARLAARGEALYVNLNYVSFANSTPNFHATNAAEYAELMLVTFQHIQSRYGWVPDAIEVILEPDNGTSWTGTMIGNAIAATGARLAAAGFHPDFIGPSTMSMAQAVPFVNQMVAVPGALNYLSMISYHRYAGVSDANLSAIRSKAAQYGLRTAMLEHIGSGVEDLYKDLTMANVSSWQQFTVAFPTADDGAQYYLISGGQPVIASRTKQLRQYFRYVRFGAQRVAATSISSGVRPVAFTNPGGGMAVVLHVDAAGSYSVSGIRPGTYAVELTNGAGTRSTLPNVTATGSNSVTVAPSQTGVLTLYRLP
ncbi:MAG: hypothetical protein SFU84_03315 [Gemmatimonadales bacterium]|nr:hypothetical protein [Gemmatimonadales bacterium]